jgi:hypothetical protein
VSSRDRLDPDLPIQCLGFSPLLHPDWQIVVHRVGCSKLVFLSPCLEGMSLNTVLFSNSSWRGLCLAWMGTTIYFLDFSQIQADVAIVYLLEAAWWDWGWLVKNKKLNFSLSVRIQQMWDSTYLNLALNLRFVLTPVITSFFPILRGCLTQEKIVAGYASRFIVIADFR